VIADRIAHGEMAFSALAVPFSIPDEQLAARRILVMLERAGRQVKRQKGVGRI
jgi:hypothetical protein